MTACPLTDKAAKLSFMGLAAALLQSQKIKALITMGITRITNTLFIFFISFLLSPRFWVVLFLSLYNLTHLLSVYLV
jgi:hypothetical protein